MNGPAAIAPHANPVVGSEPIWQNVSAGDQGDVSIIVGSAPVYAKPNSYPPPLDCRTVNLAAPRGMADAVLGPEPGDPTPEAALFRSLPQLALAVATRLVEATASLDYTDGNGADHRDGAAAGIARAIELFAYRTVPWPDYQRDGWRATLGRLLSLPLFTWHDAIPGHTWRPSADYTLAFPAQQRGVDADGRPLYALHPAYGPFYFWGGSLSLYRFVRYSAADGFLFTSTFLLRVQSAIEASFFSIAGGNPERFQSFQMFDPSRTYTADEAAGAYWGVSHAERTYGQGGDVGTQYSVTEYVGPPLWVDGLEWCAGATWIEQTLRVPRVLLDRYRSMADAARDARRKKEVIEGVAFILAVFAIGAAVSAISTAGLTMSNAGSLLSAIDGLPSVDLQGAGKWVKIVGRFFNPTDVVRSLGLTAVENAEPVADVATEAATDAASDAGGAMEGWEDYGEVAFDPPAAFEEPFPQFDAPVFEVDVPAFDPWFSEPGFDAPVVPEVTIYTGIEDSPSVAEAGGTFSGEPTLMDGLIDSAQQQAGGGIFGGSFDLSRLVSSLTDAYLRIEQSRKAGQVPAAAARPTPGQVRQLPDGSTLRTNADGSTTITSPTGEQRTVTPSGRVIPGGPGMFGGPSWIPGVPNAAVIAGGALVAMLALARR